MKHKHFILLTLAAIIGSWVIWSHAGRQYDAPKPEAALDIIESVALDSSCRRNVVAIQPYMKPDDYLSEKHFYEKLNTYFEAAKGAGFLQENTAVVLPEYLGAWLVIAGEKKFLSETSSLNGGMAVMALSNFFSFMRHWMLFNPENSNEAVLFRMKAMKMAGIYSSVFRRLAAQYRVTIIAGSVILPDPTVYKNEISVHVSGELFNVTFIFHPDGTIEPKTIKKTFLINDEQPFLTSCPIEELPVFDLPIGKTAVLICADSWFPESYAEASKKKAEVLLVPSYAVGNGKFRQLWEGYDGHTAPADVNPSDAGLIKEAEAWKKYALPGRFPSDAILGVNVFLRGELWDLGSDGETFIVHKGKLITVRQSQRAGIWNICF
ncbi:MAG: nitrilase-related carbon-nitrogen hydrolase [Cyclobacteriaceae bacterium]|nr:nitrilase-related carbon-nitrogen hydrolase [Cyclobacteriaceae bacterium]